MTVVERVGERLARRLDRRRSVTRSAGAVFAWTAAWATLGPFGSTALAYECRGVTELDCTCNFPFGRDGRQLVCRKKNPNYCDGAKCSGNCEYNYDFYTTTACWCSKTCRHGKGRHGHYMCCDCKCPKIATVDNPGGLCGCQKFTSTR
jgi:hypothetical protein